MHIDVLIIGSSFPMPMAGGSINYIYNILGGLKGLDCMILTAKGDIQLNEKFDSNYPFKIIRSKFIYHILEMNRGSRFLRVFNLLMSVLLAMKYIVKLNPKIVYFTEFSFLTISAFFVAPFRKTKIGIFTYSEELQQCERRIIHKKLMKKVFYKFDIIITVCEYTRDFINSFGCYDGKIFKIIPPVSLKNVSHQSTNLGILNKIKILTVARLEERKGHVAVVEAVSKLHSIHPNLEYNIVGVGRYKVEIEKAIAKYEANEYIHFLGKLSDIDLENIYQNSDIFVMPHRQLANGDTEGCPTVFLEAGYYKLPVIGGDAGGVSDAILHEQTGYIAHPGTEELYNYLKILIESKSLREDLGNCGHNYACQFVTENQARKFKEVTYQYL